MKQKRLAAFLLAILMLVFTFPVQAAGADEDEPAYEYDEVEADLEEDGGGDGPDAELTASAGGAGLPDETENETNSGEEPELFTAAVGDGAVSAYAAAPEEAFELVVEGPVMVDGTGDQTVDVSLVAKTPRNLCSIRGQWGTDTDDTEKTGYLTLAALSAAEEMGQCDFDAAAGSVDWADGAGTGVEISTGQPVLTATYIISKDAPAGEYPVSFSLAGAGGAEPSDDVAEGAYSASITVERSEGGSAGQDPYGVYQIGTPEELRAFAQAVNGGEASADAVLTADIDVSGAVWTPIAGYAGTFDGAGHVVTYVFSAPKTDQPAGGLFATIEDGAVIQNLTVEGSTAGLANVSGAGGVVATANGGTVVNCVNKADVSGQMGGGIAGRAKGTARIENCVNYGAVSYKNGPNGGIVGQLEGEAAVTGCVNYGEVSADEGTVLQTGGIVGLFNGTGTVSQCANFGTVSGLWQGYGILSRGVGGIVGCQSAAGTVDSCYNAGGVNGHGYVGGVVGYMSAAQSAVTNCYNTGDVSAQAGTSTYPGYAGGVVGRAANKATVSNCFNTGVAASEDGNARGVVCHVGPNAASVAGITNNYYLDTCAADPNAAAQSAVELLTLAGALGTAYKDGSAHPLLTWQEDETPVSTRTVMFSITPMAARLELVDSAGRAVAPAAAQSGVYTYRLAAEEAYTYSVTLEGYYPVAEKLPGDSSYIAVTLEADKRQTAQPDGVIYGDSNLGMPNTVVSGGTYQLGAGARGVLRIETAGPVTLLGGGEALQNLYISCVVPGVSLTLENVSISNSVGAANLLHFTGRGNKLYFSGTNLLEQTSVDTGYAMIHVPTGTELTIGGTTTGDTLYLYKSEQGAGIGGNGKSDSGLAAEYNGNITFTQGRILMKGTKQGALIGSGASAGTAAGTPGNITINGGFIHLIANARGAAIGGSAGEAGATGANVYLNGGTVTINVNFSGAAIGGGGYGKGNDAAGGRVFYSGGSIRTYIDENAASTKLWDVPAAGVNGNIGITADVRNQAGDDLYLCVLDTGGLGIEGESFTVLDGENLIYSGGLHIYRYINEDKPVQGQVNVSDTTTNWVQSDDTCLYLYLTGETHTLTVNGAKYTAEWDESEGSFAIYPVSAVRLSAPVLSGQAKITKDSVALTPPAPSQEEKAAVLEYRVSGDGGKIWSEWQESPVFTGLKANTEYTFQARYRAVDTARYSSSAPSEAVTLKTKEDPNAFQCEVEVSGRTVTASVSGTNYTGLPDDYGVLTADLVTGKSGITQVEVTISGGTLAAMAADRELSAFALETDLGLVSFDDGAISAIARDAEDSDAVFNLIKNSETEYSIELTVDGKPVFTKAEGGSIDMQLPYSRRDDQMSVLVYDDKGSELESEYNPRTEIVSFTMSRLSDVTIKEVKKGDPYASVWDGLSLDISWFAPGKSSYYISTPAQLMGLAALVNGIYNDEITTIVGDVSYIVNNVSDGGSSGGNNESTDTYHYGDYNFDGATVYLTADLDMGGADGANYMPIGGQYLMTKDDYSTRVDASFCGVFDGGGHTVGDIYCDRYCSGNYGDGSSVGLIGRLGVHDNDTASLRPAGAVVRNVAVDGYFYANRSVGGVVGKIGKTDGGVTIESCVNYATVVSTDTKGCGGIVGAGWNTGVIRDCYNAGTVQSRYPNPTGGISGSNEVTLENCYNVGSISAGSASFAMGIGTNNGGASYNSYVVNCWYLEGSAPGGGYYSGNTAYNDHAMTGDAMKTAEFVRTLGDAFAMDTENINGGYPVLAWQEHAEAGVVIESTTTVKDGVATTTVTEKAVSASVAAAQKAKADTLLIITDINGKSADRTVVEIPQTSVKEIAGASLNLSVETADGSKVILSAKVLSSAANQAAGKTVELTVTPETGEDVKELLSRTSGYENTYLGSGVAVSIGMGSGGKEIDGFTSDFDVEIPVDSESFQSGETYSILRISGDGTVERLNGKCAAYGGQLYISFSASGFGTFIVLNQAGVVIESTTTVKDGVATTAVTEKAVSASVAAARNAKADTLLIITDTNGKSADKTIVEIPRTSVKEIAGASLGLSVETADGSKVAMSAKVLSSAGERAAGKTVELTVKPETGDYVRELLGKAGGYENTYLTGCAAVSIGISSADAEINNFPSALGIEIPVNGEDFQSGAVYDVLQILSGGTVNRLSGTCVVDGGQLYVSFSASGLGTFVALKQAPVVYGDVNPDDWFYGAVMYVTEKGLMNGIGNDLFDPDGLMTRAMMVTVLYRLEGSPAAAGAGTFADVARGQWYSDAVAWAAANEIVEGYGDGRFGPADHIDRQQIAAILYRYAAFKGYDVAQSADLAGYTDAGEIAVWAKEGMIWANACGLITGRTDSTLVPDGSASRSEIATILMRACRTIIETEG